MRKLLLLPLFAFGCSTPNYVYNFDLTDPGANNASARAAPDTLEDADVRADILADPTAFHAISLALTNKTNDALNVQWDQITITLPDGSSLPVRPDSPLNTIAPGTRVSALLVQFILPSQGDAAKAFDNGNFVLTVPVTVRGYPRMYQYHLHSALQKL